ncbi:MAG: UspA [Rhodocyclaceae bacterium]|nr:UspA [Rhodocyclaceae bacterium]
MNILLPVDGSPCSDRAVDYLVGHGACLRDSPHIHLLNVHPPIPIGRIQAHVSHDSLTAYYREESEALLAGAKGRLEAAGLAYTPHIQVGQPGETIAKLAVALNCELIVMGSHGRGMVTSMVTGSVAAKVIHFSTCPVLLVK